MVGNTAKYAKKLEIKITDFPYPSEPLLAEMKTHFGLVEEGEKTNLKMFTSLESL